MKKDVLFIDVEAVFDSSNKDKDPEVFIYGKPSNEDEKGIYTVEKTDYGDIRLYTDGEWNLHYEDLITGEIPNIDVSFSVSPISRITIDASSSANALDSLVVPISNSFIDDPTLLLVNSGTL